MSQKLYIYSWSDGKGDREFTSTGKGLEWFCFVVEKVKKKKKRKERQKRNEVRGKKEVLSQVATNLRNPICFVVRITPWCELTKGLATIGLQ